MSGHSKWSTIKHKKAAADQKRGKLFSELARAITIAVRQGKSGDPTMNPTLRLALEKARAANMPNDNVKRAISRGLGIGAAGMLEEIVYEGYGPAGVGVMVVVRTDNRQRTGSQIRNIFERVGGSLGGPGAAAYLFERVEGRVVVKVPLPVASEADRKSVAAFVDELHELEEVESVVTNMVL